MLRKESTQDLVKPESPWETLNRFQRNLSALQDDDHDDDPDDHDDDDNHQRNETISYMQATKHA